MILDKSAAQVLYDGMLTDPQLDHPEGVAVHRDGSVWCGGERGQIYRISADGSSMAQVASTGGYCLGMAFDKDDNLYVCDLKHQAVIRVDAKSDTIDKFATDADGRSRGYPTSQSSMMQAGFTSPILMLSRNLVPVSSVSIPMVRVSSGTRSH